MSSDVNEMSSVLSPLKAVRAHCLWCCNGLANEVSLCAANACPLHPYRMGRNPDKVALLEDGTAVYPAEKPAARSELVADGATGLGMIRRRCMDCSGGSVAEVKACQATGCALWPFRLGRNPNRVGYGGSFKQDAIAVEKPRLT